MEEYTNKKEEISKDFLSAARLLNDEIKEALQKRKDLNKELSNCLGTLNNSAIWMKAQIIKYSVECYINNQMTKVKKLKENLIV